jgi:DNA polymerase (family 10)
MKLSAYANHELAKILFEFAYYETILGTPFKPRAYEMASETLVAMGDDIQKTWEKGGIKELKKLPGIGQAIAEKIDEFYRTGKVKSYIAMKKKYPVDMWRLASIEGIGPMTINMLYRKLKVKNLKDLERVVKQKKIRKLPGFGEKSEEKIRRGIQMMKQASGRHVLGDVLPLADRIVHRLKKVPGVKRCTYAGSLRRRKETVGDIDLLITSTDPKRAMSAFVSLPEVLSIHEKGKTRGSVRLKLGIDADLRVVPDEVYGAALQYFTGDKRHNVLLRQHAQSKGYLLNEYGLFKTGKGLRAKGKGSKNKLIACKTEEEIYKHLGMATPPPEIRIGEDEMEAAKKKKLPKLIPYGSVKGDLQVQTDWSDGAASIEATAKAAKAQKLSYMAVTDHTKSLGIANGLDDRKVKRQIETIKKLNRKLKGFTVLTGTECDIKVDGSLDLKDETLKKLQWVGVSIHSSFRKPKKEQTARVLKAISNPYVDCLFHPFCQIINQRAPIDLDFDEVLAAAKKYRVILEIDAFPDRSDLDAAHVRAAVQAGVPLAINTDAHHPDHFEYIELGEAIARRGWAGKADVVNTKNVKDLLAFLSKKRKR